MPALKGIFFTLLLFATSLAAEEGPWLTTLDDGSRQVRLYFFWSSRCPHCQEARPFIEALPQRYSWLTLHSANIIDDPQALQRYRQMAAALGQEARSVPAFFLCGQMFVGWDGVEGMGRQLLQNAERCRLQGPAALQARPLGVQIPLFGELAAEDYSLPLFTLIIAALDAFNPCAFFVLLFLLSLLVNARSRGRMLLIGGTFVLVSGALYFLFMAAWLNLFLLVGSMPWITTVAGLLALVIGLFGIKDFWFALRGPSLSIPAAAKSRLFGRMRGLLSTERLPLLLLGTVTLAVAANSYELLCTAGFPMVYTRTLTLHHLAPLDYYLYLLFYNVVYVIPLALIVLLFVITLGAHKLSLTEGRLLKLLSGIMMIGLGLVLLLKPELLNNLLTGVVLLSLALAATLLARIRLRRAIADQQGVER